MLKWFEQSEDESDIEMFFFMIPTSDTSWECFICDNSELSCWNFLQWESMVGLGINHHPHYKR